MGLPYRTFTESATLLDTLIASKLSSTVVGTLYNLSYRSILESFEWSARKAELVLNTLDPYSTGTVATTQGSTTVTGTSTVWTSSHTGMFMRINSEDVIYEFTRVSATSGTLEKAWALAAVTGATYELFQYKYSVDSTDGTVGQLLLPYEGLHMEPRSLDWLLRRDPARRSSGTPLAYILHGVDSDGSQMIEFWPRYSAAAAISIPYYRRIDDIAGSTKPIIRSDVIEAMALSLCYARMAAEFGDAWYDRLHTKWDARYRELLEAAIHEDLQKHNLPRSVHDEIGRSFDHEFIVTHDV